MKEDMFKSGEYPAQFLFKHMLKDLNFILETARQTGFAAKLEEPFVISMPKDWERGLASEILRRSRRLSLRRVQLRPKWM